MAWYLMVSTGDTDTPIDGQPVQVSTVLAMLGAAFTCIYKEG